MLPRNTKTLWTKVMGAWLLSLFGTLEFTIEPAKRKCCHKFSASNNALAVRVGFAPTGAVETVQVSDFAICSLCGFGPSFEILVRIEDVSVIPSRSMPTEHIVALLIEERDKLNLAIEALQGPLRRRGRPPKALATLKPPANPQAVAATHKRRKTPVWSAARKKAHIARMKAYWAKRNAKK